MNAPVKSKPDLAALARASLVASEGSTDTAIDILAEQIATNKALQKSIAAEALDDAIRYNILIAHHYQRRVLHNAMVNGRESVRSLATGLTRTILDFPLLDGTKLRDASLDDLDRAIHRYRTQAENMNRTANWLVLIRNITPEQGMVGDVLDDATAQRLFEEAVQ